MANIMQKFNNSKVKEKLSTMTRSMIIMLFGLGLTAVIGAFELNTQTKTLANEWMVANNLIADIDYYTSEYRLTQYNHVVSDTEADFDTAEKKLGDISKLPASVNEGQSFAMIIINNETGDLVATVGGAGKKKGNMLINMSEEVITPASTMKPLSIYAPLLDDGKINKSK